MFEVTYLREIPFVDEPQIMVWHSDESTAWDAAADFLLETFGWNRTILSVEEV